MIEIKYGKSYSDQTFEYIITIQKPMTVGEFIKEWMTIAPKDWGYFGIYNRDSTSIFGNPKCEYSKGKIITDPIPDEYLNAKIDEVSGSGGWTRSDFIFKTGARITLPQPRIGEEPMKYDFFDHWNKTEMTREEALDWFESGFKVTDGKRCSPTCPQCQAEEWAIKALSAKWHAYPDEKPPKSGYYLISEDFHITENNKLFVWTGYWDGEYWYVAQNYEGPDSFDINEYVYAWMSLPEPMPRKEENNERKQ